LDDLREADVDLGALGGDAGLDLDAHLLADGLPEDQVHGPDVFVGKVEGLEAVEHDQRPLARYKVGQEVLYVALVDGMGYYTAGEKLAGTIITAFFNGGGWTYRIRMKELRCEKKGAFPNMCFVFGNISEERIRPLE